MRHLLQPRVLNWSVVAAALSTLACYPRLSLWQNRTDTVWSLEFLIFFCGIVLWGFVFAWHGPYTNRSVWSFKLKSGLFVIVTVIGISSAMAFHLWLDPSLRSKMPEDYPTDLKHWIAFVLFSLAFNQLFLLFAPFDWLMRLVKKRWVAASFTVLFGIFVLSLRIGKLSTPFPPLLLGAFLASEIAMGFLSVLFYLRGGVILIWWWSLLFESRHLLEL